MRSGLRICALALSFACGACGQPLPPPVARSVPSLETDDLSVMKGVLDDVRQRRGAGRFLVVDTTTAVCEGKVDLFGAPPGGCLSPKSVDSVSKVLEPGRSRIATLDFEARNASRLPIAGTLGPDVTYISGTLTDFVSMRDLLAQHPGSAVVTFSAPSYPAPRVAVMIYRVRDAENGAVRLEQQADGRWTVADRYGAME